MTIPPNNDLEQLHQQIAALANEKAASDAQRELLEKVVAMARSPAQEEVLKVMLQETLDLASKLTSAETGSLFLLDNLGAVTDSLLTQQEAAAEVRAKLIGTVLDKGLAGWVNRHRKLGLIIDTEVDDRWITLPNQPYEVRSALAVPILRGNELLGILTLQHCRPSHFTPEIAQLMQVTADQIALVLDNAQLYNSLEDSYRDLDKAKQKVDAYSKALDAELEKGRQIQLDFLPNTIPKFPNWEIAACFYPARQVAGDFYDIFVLPNKCIGLVIADVCDKGVGAALFMALFRSLIRVFSGQAILANWSSIEAAKENVNCIVDPLVTADLEQINALKAVPLTNNYIAEEHSEMSMFATLFFGVLNPETGTLTYINGGHEPLFVINQGVIKQQLDPTGPAVGMMPNMKFKIKQMQFEPDDILLGYTDGVTEAHSPDRKLYTSARLKSLLELPSATATDLLKRVEVDLSTYMADAAQFDDITMLAVRWTIC
jgi:phosphoserine phosphatase RsbU/P